MTKSETRHNAYKGTDGQSFFDADAPVQRDQRKVKSSAFDATEVPKDIKSSAGSIASLKKAVRLHARVGAETKDSAFW